MLPPLATADSPLVKCPPCNGTGGRRDEEDPSIINECGYCHGTGMAVDDVVTQSFQTYKRTHA